MNASREPANARDPSLPSWASKLIWLLCHLLIGASTDVLGAISVVDSVATMREKYVSLAEQLGQNQFKQPLVLDSAETPNGLQGDIYAIVDFPFAAVSAGLNNPDHWCDVMLLHVNTKYCHAGAGLSGTTLSVNIGRKTPEALADTSRVEFNYSVAVSAADYLEITLDAKDGPLGTSSYRIILEAMTLPNAKSFLHLRYSYAMNFSAKLAMRTYLGTVGSDKVGFTVSRTPTEGQDGYIGGVRGLVERNTMRYYLAIASYLGSVSMAPAAQLEHRLQSWFTAVEQYPRQLHELDRSAYLEMKRAEHLRQQTVH
jgi:hypothetical protein